MFLMEEIAKEIGYCRSCKREMADNKSSKTCDGCGTPVPFLSRELYEKILLSNQFVNVDWVLGPSKKFIYGFQIFGVK